MSVVAGKKIANNTAWGGNPARKIADDVFWDGACVHNWKEEMTQRSQNYEQLLTLRQDGSTPDQYIYNYDRNEVLSYSELDDSLNHAKSSEAKFEMLHSLPAGKNRFVHK